MKNILKIAALCAFAFSWSSCSKLVDGQETNPNAPADATPNLIIEGLQAADVFVHEGEMARMAGMWCGYFTGADRQYLSIYNYDVTAGDFDNAWNGAYVNALFKAKTLITKAEAINDESLAGLGKLIQAHVAGTITALWGDVPYRQAGNFELYPTPAYDSQIQIYADLQTLLDEAIVQLQGPGTADGYSAVMTAGDWVKVAHSLKARYYLHTGNFADAATHAAMGITSSADNWIANHPGSSSLDANLYYQFIDLQRGGYLSVDGSFMQSLLNARGETGLAASYFTTPANSYSNLDPNYVNGIFAYDANFTLFSAAENQMILAEAMVENGGYDINDIVTLLNGVRGMVGTTYPSATGYAAGDFATEADLLKEISTLKFIALYGQIEGFSDMRRTDNRVGITPSSGTQLPERFLYPQAEINSNPSIPASPSLYTPTQVNQ